MNRSEFIDMLDAIVPLISFYLTIIILIIFLEDRSG